MTNENLNMLQRCLERIEGDWEQIDAEWGPTDGGLEGAIERGEETLIPELRAAVAAEASPWLPIDSAPKDGTEVLVLCDGVWRPAEFATAYARWMGMKGWLKSEPTHWMPIPPLSETKP